MLITNIKYIILFAHDNNRQLFNILLRTEEGPAVVGREEKREREWAESGFSLVETQLSSLHHRSTDDELQVSKNSIEFNFKQQQENEQSRFS